LGFFNKLGARIAPLFFLYPYAALSARFRSLPTRRYPISRKKARLVRCTGWVSFICGAAGALRALYFKRFYVYRYMCPDGFPSGRSDEIREPARQQGGTA